MSEKTRLYVDTDLALEQHVTLSREQAHYLFGVMRLGAGDKVSLFNSRDGEWQATVLEATKRAGLLECVQQTAPLRTPPDLWLMFAPIKKARTDFIVEKAAEMGAARIMPVLTDFTNSERVRQPRLQAHAVEAAEQCGATFVPEVTDAERLDRVLAHWEPERRILFCDEGMAGQGTQFGALDRGPWAILIGPEGGFSPAERARIAAHPASYAIALGPRILRADTAAVAALTLWQSALGDW